MVSFKHPVLWAGIAAAALLSLGISRITVAATYADPVSRVRAQDESIYADSALELTQSGRWLTPRFMGRYLLFKPPLLVWAAAVSMKSFGANLWALRLPALLSAILATILLVDMAGRFGLLALSLLLSSALWHTYAKLSYTDMLLAAFVVLAIWVLNRDLSLSRATSVAAFAAACAGGIMSKNAAGLLPLLVALLVTVLGKIGFLSASQAPSGKRILHVCALIAIIAGPWHVYQLVAHREWFITEYVKIQLFAFGLNPPAQYSSEPGWLFYLTRTIRLEPVLFALVALGTLRLWTQVRARDPHAVMVACWSFVVGGALLSFRYRNVPYLLQAIPPMVLIGAKYGPWNTRRRYTVAVSLIGLSFAIRLAVGAHPLAVQMTTEDPPPAWRLMRSYAKSNRSPELVAIMPDDEFYSATLNLPKVRYVFLDPSGEIARLGPHYVYLGVTLNTSQALALPSIQQKFESRLLAWGLNSTEPIGTTITARTPKDLLQLVRAFPESDLYLPEELWRQARIENTHYVFMALAGRVLALAREAPHAVITSRFRAPNW